MIKTPSQNKKATELLGLINNLRRYHMSRKSILDFINDFFLNSGGFNRRIVAEWPTKDEFDCTISDKTVSRRIKTLREMFGDRLVYNKGTYFLDLDDFPDVLTVHDAIALKVAAQTVGGDVNIADAIERIGRSVVNKQMQYTYNSRDEINLRDKINTPVVISGPVAHVQINQKIKQALLDAVFYQHIVTIKYGLHNYKIAPLEIIYTPDDILIMSAHVRTNKPSKKIAFYSVSSITKVVDTNVWFQKDNNINVGTYIDTVFGLHTHAIQNIELHVAKQVAERVKRYTFNQSQDIIENTSDGTLTIKFQSGALSEIARFIAGWGGQIIPIAPQQLRDEYRKLTQCL